MGNCCLNNRKDSIKNEKAPSQKFLNRIMLSDSEEEHDIIRNVGNHQELVMSDEQALKE